MKGRIEQLEKERRLLISRVSKWKRKYEAISPRKPVRETRTKRALEMVMAWHDGDKSKRFKDIAKECHLSIETIKNISYKYRQKNTPSKDEANN
jgi:hypothetical protein